MVLPVLGPCIGFEDDRIGKAHPGGPGPALYIVEDAGFEATTVPAEIDRLLAVAAVLLGDLSAAAVEQTWAGLRPGSVDGLPSIGPTPACSNAFVAGGHFRAGLHQSTGTAVIVADLIEGRRPPLDIAAFAADRPPGPPGPDSVAVYLARAAAES